MDLRKLKKLIDLVQESGIAELEITEGEEKVRIARGGAVSITPPASGGPQFAVPASAPAAPAAAAASAAAPAAEAAPGGHVVKSPMVGTFYRAPSPDAKPFVEVGATIKAGETICVLEAMKLMNEIEAEFKGRVVQVLVENAQPIEFGQKLFLVEPV
jgi:acetyl-CoA carboxylase biotin carboxyl carrier protein